MTNIYDLFFQQLKTMFTINMISFIVFFIEEKKTLSNSWFFIKVLSLYLYLGSKWFGCNSSS